MTEQAFSTLPRAAKGPLAPPPGLDGALEAISGAIAAWPSVEATTHWHLNDKTQVDGIDFYVGDDELGHIHLDGSIHLATTPELGGRMVSEGSAGHSPGRAAGRPPGSTASASTARWRCSAGTTTGCDRRRGPDPIGTRHSAG